MGSGGCGGGGIVWQKARKIKKRQIRVFFLDFKNPNIKIYNSAADIFPNF